MLQMKYIPKNLAVSFDLLPMALPKPREQNNFTFLCFLTEEILTDAFCDRPEAGQSVQYLWKLKECFSILVLDIKKQTTSQEKKDCPTKSSLRS